MHAPRHPQPIRFALFVLLAIAAGCASGGGGTRQEPRRTGPGGRAGMPAPGGIYDIAYRVAMPDTAGHHYDVSIDLDGVLGDSLELQMPVWSPGRYAPMYFARNVRGFTVTTDSGKAVRYGRVNGSLWRVYPAKARRLHVNYQVYANNLSGTFSVVDTAHANWNGASLFMYVVGFKAHPVRLTVVPPRGWHVINGDSRVNDQLEFQFPYYDRLIDTPTEVARHFDVDSFRVDGRLYRVMVHYNGDQRGQRERFVRDIEKIVRYENRVIAPPPLDMYTFMFNIGYAGGDGMEHLYSTQIITAAPWTDTAAVLPGISSAAHEYFHTWNVKRIRPIALGPFDYTREQYQPSLWVAEGWTQYYGEIGLLRAGVVDKGAYYRTLGRVIRANSEAPGRKEVSARLSSILAPFWDGAATPMAVDRTSYFSYYTKGDALALLLDLEIRSRTHNTRSLDDALRTLKDRTWDTTNVSYYLQGRGYTEGDVERAVSAAAGADLHEWFQRYVGGVEDLPFTQTLALAGLTVTVRTTGDEREYVVEEMPGATPDQLRVREGWLTGTAAPAATQGKER
jgi:predicted metalloprotease with PDZ domain